MSNIPTNQISQMNNSKALIIGSKPLQGNTFPCKAIPRSDPLAIDNISNTAGMTTFFPSQNPTVASL